jgi:5-methylthioadenosine/S-adenosylhomocysteine deaminase
VWVGDEDVQILRRRGVGVSHNPESNMKLASGAAPVIKYLAAGVALGLGTDGAASTTTSTCSRRAAGIVPAKHAAPITAVPAAPRSIWRRSAAPGRGDGTDDRIDRSGEARRPDRRRPAPPVRRRSDGVTPVYVPAATTSGHDRERQVDAGPEGLHPRCAAVIADANRLAQKVGER